MGARRNKPNQPLIKRENFHPCEQSLPLLMQKIYPLKIPTDKFKEKNGSYHPLSIVYYNLCCQLDTCPSIATFFVKPTTRTTTLTVGVTKRREQPRWRGNQTKLLLGPSKLPTPYLIVAYIVTNFFWADHML